MVASKKTFFKANHYTPLIMLSKSLQMYQRRVGRSLRGTYCKENLVPSRKQVAHKLSGTKGGLSGPKEFQDLYSDKIILVATDNTTVVANINNKGGMRSGPLCAVLCRILTWCFQETGDCKGLIHSRQLNVLADKLSRQGQTIQTKWSLLPEVYS